MSAGTVWQRHTRQCPRDEQGTLTPHRCRGPWSYTVDAGRHPDGKRRQATKTGFATRREAQSALDDQLSLLRAGIRQRRRLTVGDYLDEWLLAKRNLRPTTRKSYQYHLDSYLKPALGHYPLQELRADHIDVLYSSLLDGRRGHASPAVVHHIHRTLRSALNTAVKRRLLQWNPATQVELPEHRVERTQVWDADQVSRYLAAAEGERLLPLLQLIVFTGLRRGEALGLHWADVSFTDREIRVAWQVVDLPGGPALGRPKTAAGYRVVPLDQETAHALQLHRERQLAEQEQWGEGWHDLGLVFARENGQLLRPELITKTHRRIAERAGLPPIRLHDLRHTHASLALAAGVDIKVVSDRLGHSTTTITRDLYTHVVPGVAREAADAIAALVRRRPVEGGC